MLKFVLVAFLILISHVLALDTCVEFEYDTKMLLCDEDHGAVYECKRFGIVFFYSYKWIKKEDCKFCCYKEQEANAYCLSSKLECKYGPGYPGDDLVDPEFKQERCNVQKVYNRFRRE